MRLMITDEERKYLISRIEKNQDALLKKLQAIRKRKSTKYKKCDKEQKEKNKLLEELIRNNFLYPNVDIIKKLGISKATFYRLYAEKAKRLKEKYREQSLFK